MLAGEKFFFGKSLSLTLTRSYSKGYYGSALKFSAEQINVIRKKIQSMICYIMNRNIDFRTFVNSSLTVFLTKH